MNYTETYRKIYSSIKNEDINHEVAHHASLRITDAVNYIYITLNKYNEDTLNVIKETVKDIKIGGYDLDDNGQPVGFGIKATGLNSNE